MGSIYQDPSVAPREYVVVVKQCRACADFVDAAEKCTTNW